MKFPIEIIKEKIGAKRLEELAKKGYGEMVKVAVDIEKGVLAAGGEFHMDASEVLYQGGSESKNIWGANIYLNRPRDKRIEFIALINIKPNQDNRTMEIQNSQVKDRVKKIINDLIE